MKKKIRIKVEKEEIVGTLFTPPPSHAHPVIIFLNGRGGIKERYYPVAEHFLGKGYVSFCFDFRGKGESITKKIPPMKHQLEDFKAVVNYIKSMKQVKSDKLIIVATSMGAYVALSLSNTWGNLIKKMVLFEPSLFNKSAEDVPFMNLSVEDVVKALDNHPEKSRSVKNVSKYTGELYLVIQGDTEYYEGGKAVNEIYYSYAEKATVRKKMEIPDIDHNIFKTKKGTEKAIELLDKIL